MNYLFWLYVFASCIIISGSTFYFYSKGEEATAGIMLFGIMITAIYFGNRWFRTSGQQLSKGIWPPVINYCPDFLTLNTINNEQVCVDTIGITKLANMSKWTSPTQTDEKYLFHLFLNTYGQDRINKICEQAKTKNVTWEGVWDGATCMGVDPPGPPRRSS
jgi:hypothetical protein